MKNLTLLFLVFLFVSCATYSELPESSRHYDNYGYYYYYPNMYFEPYPFWTGRHSYDYYWNYTPRYDNHIYIGNQKDKKPEHIKDSRGYNKPDKNKQDNGNKGTYTPTYRKPDNNTTPRFNSRPSNNTPSNTTTPSTRQPAGGSRSSGGRNNP